MLTVANRSVSSKHPSLAIPKALIYAWGGGLGSTT